MNLLNIAVVSRCFSDRICRIISAVIHEVFEYGCNILMLSESSRYFSYGDIVFYDDLNDLMQKSDMVFVVGGDGTLIYYAKKAAAWGKKVFGINGGNLGFLCGCRENEAHKIGDILAGNYKLSTRTMLEIDINGKVFTALNDVVFNRDISSSILKYNVYIGEKIVFECESDGIIFATPTGSTAYSFSAGGPIVEPETKCVILTPICAHDFCTRSTVFNDKNEFCVSVENLSNKDKKICVSVDGSVQRIDFDMLSGVRIKKSADYARIINFTDCNFYDNIRKKLMNRTV